MTKKRIVVHNKELCKFKNCGYSCIKTCPINRSGDECIVKDENGFPVFNEELCIGCGFCVKACEKAGFNAIDVVNLPKELEEYPIYRYGINGFALYRLPIPKNNSIVGLIGANGMGKTTVLNILSGNLKPNLGLFEKEITWQMIIEKFKGTELQEYLLKLSQKNVKIGYKPQNVDLIPNVWKGKVMDLLGKYEGYEKIVEILEIKSILEKDIKDLSGGELQLIAIASVLLKKCDLYFFDEPSSYLDVKQRLLIAKQIRNLCSSSRVIIVEHDLAVLDYLSDYVHIIYGKPGSFGVVSQSYGVRVGINAYLEGFIKEENIRFREKPIYFSKTAKESKKTQLLFKFESLEKNFENFSLKVEGGEIHKGEIIGIIGPNGTGKTTFIKMLVGEIKPDKGKGIENLSLSYKPQRLLIDGGDIDTKEYIKNKIGGKITDVELKKIISFLGIERNFEKNVKDLSGGELQAVFILCALGKDCDIILLDEPSAFLDVEQRLKIAKIIRSFVEDRGISAFVVDHDLQLIDSISDRIMVFEGEMGVRGFGNSPCSLKDGMNKFLKTLGITFRRDPHTGRARVNKPDSQKDREQKEMEKYYYAD
ncbi:MAG: ribosome biogenesis/translation initiation ATPase RLI [Candidatus Aenigmatarchaeota archaeon]